VKVYVPAVAGVPVRAPFDPSVIPGGSEPVLTVQVALEAPEAVSVAA
jgi:hypothetical protein